MSLKIFMLFLSLLLTLSPKSKAAKELPAVTVPELQKQQSKKLKYKRQPKYYYSYIDRQHSLAENTKLLGQVYALSWAIYPLSQPKVVRDNGSWSNYKKNFGELVFDKDEPFWNWFVHPISGSQLFLIYRAYGHSRSSALAMSFISSTLFEFTIEIYTEPASIQDLYQTPILGALLGLTLENLSLYLLNTGNALGRLFGHILNPSTLFPFYEGKIKVLPAIGTKGKVGLNLTMDF